MSPSDTIFAPASSISPCARIIVRLSGPDAHSIATTFVPTLTITSPSASRHTLSVKNFHLPATIYTFLSPKSYTGEHLVEFHIPGNLRLLHALTHHLTNLGARPADPGEFTARAYFNGKLDLTEAEGVAATISALNETQRQAARQLLSGELARRLRPIMDNIAETLALVEVGIDFTDEDVTFIERNELARRINSAIGAISTLTSESARFDRLSAEPTVVLTGKPNAGKSTLLNTLAKTNRAVISAVPGTTRDILSADVYLPHGIIKLLDIAGLETPGANPIDQQMQQRARQAIESADVVVLLHDAQDPTPPPSLPRPPHLIVRTKSDLIPNPPPNPLHLSAHTAQNLEEFRTRLDELCFSQSAPGATLALNDRHLQNLTDARTSLQRASQNIAASSEFLALDLRESLDSLGNILGLLTPDDILSKVFSRFCIGK